VTKHRYTTSDWVLTFGIRAALLTGRASRLGVPKICKPLGDDEDAAHEARLAGEESLITAQDRGPKHD
jgi:hypothetical protein